MIAELGTEHVPMLCALWTECGLTRPWNDPAADARAALIGSTSTIFGAWVDGTLAGSVMVGFDGHRGWVYYLAVAPGHRGAGLGRALMEAAEAWLAARGCPAIRLMVRDDNVQALGFYAAIGYQDQSVRTLGKRLDSQ
jgi:ribosomal protein S18 acetylase RimI-like enzyme